MKLGLRSEKMSFNGAIESMDGKVSIEITNHSGTGVVAFKSASVSDVEAIAAASDKIKEFVKLNKPSRLIFDFEKVKFFSSQVLGMLLDVRGQMDSYDGRVVVSAINPQLYRVFKITNLDKIFTFFKDRESAIKESKTD
ncbi:STAS domain-containing protein [Planctomycetota bacterium]